MNIYEIHEKSNVSLRTLRKLEKLGFLKVGRTEGDETLLKLTLNLRKGNPLTPRELLGLYKNPGWLESLGKHAAAGDAWLEMLGDAKRDACPWSIAAEIPGAAAGEADAIAALAKWLSQHIETSSAYEEPRVYAYVAVRLLYNIPDNLLKMNFPVLGAAMLKIRKHPAMIGKSFVDDDRRTKFRKALDL